VQRDGSTSGYWYIDKPRHRKTR